MFPLSSEKIADALRTSRTEFAALFLLAQSQADVPLEKRLEFEAVAVAAAAIPSDRDAFAAALDVAQKQGWLDKLINLIVEQGRETGSLASAIVEQARAAQNEQDAAPLQAMVNVAQGFLQPDTIMRGIFNATRWTVKILINEDAKGTGILIAPHLILTAWHVVKDLFDKNAAGEYTPKAKAAGQLLVEFDDVLVLTNRRSHPARPQRVAVDDNWCVAYSRCTEDELKAHLPDPLTGLDGYWDYAVLRLAVVPGLERRWCSPDARAAVPHTNARILLFQHPAGQPLRTDSNTIAPAPAEPIYEAVVPRLRFLHYANTVDGASGGPCFDQDFNLFGIHQGVWPVPGSSAVEPKVVNRGVPLAAVLGHIKAKFGDLPTPDPSEMLTWHLNGAENFAPVIGCDAFQDIVWQSALTGNPKIIAISGEAGSGKTFRTRLLPTMLPVGSHLIVGLPAETIAKQEAALVAQAICANAPKPEVPSLPDAPALSDSSPFPSFISPAEYHSTVTVWLRSEVVPKVMSHLEAARNGRLVWLVLTDLNRFTIEGVNTSEFLWLLYEQTLSVSWLRVVLDGMQADILESLQETTEMHLTERITRYDLETFFQRVSASFDMTLDSPFFATFWFGKYKKVLFTKPATAADLLAKEVRELVGAIAEETGKTLSLIAGGVA